MQMNFDEKLLEGLRVDPSYDEPVLHQVLRIAIYDEYHAYETYRKIIDQFGPVQPFANIVQAEVRHYSALLPLLHRYGVPVPIDNWYEKLEIPNTLVECCEAGVAAEIDNIRMYDNLLMYVSQPDIREVFFRLQAASHNNHLPAFRRCVATHYGYDALNSGAQMDVGKVTTIVKEVHNAVNHFKTNGDISAFSKLVDLSDKELLKGIAVGATATMLLTDNPVKTFVTGLFAGETPQEEKNKE